MPQGPMRFAMLLLILPLGCGRSSDSGTPTSLPPFGPHGGVFVTLPGDQGVAEVVLESPTELVRPGQAVVAVYFFQRDGQSNATALPSDLSVELELPDRAAQKISVRPSTNSRAKAALFNRMASEPGAYLVEPLLGTIRGSLNGSSFSLRFASPR